MKLSIKLTQYKANRGGNKGKIKNLFREKFSNWCIEEYAGTWEKQSPALT